jgi:hypothetical protein
LMHTALTVNVSIAAFAGRTKEGMYVA